MKKLNVHIYPTSLMYETRIEKIVECISRVDAFNEIWVIGIHSKGLPYNENKNKNIQYIRLSANTKINGYIGKIIKFIIFYYKTVKLLQNNEIKAINAHSLSVLPLAVYFKIVKKTQIIYDTHELETETPSLTGFKKSFAKIVEKLCIKKIDKIFCVSENIAEWYEKKYKIKKPVVILNSPLYMQLQKTNILRERLNIKNEVVICLYFGLLEPHRGIDQLLESASILEKEGISLVFIGYGSLECKINRYQKDNSNIYILPPTNQKELLHLASSADIGLCLIEPTSNSYNYCMPNKLFEYMAAGLPVVVGPCYSLIEFINKHKTGVIASKIEVKVITRSIIEAKLKNKNEMNSVIEKVFKEICWQQESKKLTEYYSAFRK